MARPPLQHLSADALAMCGDLGLGIYLCICQRSGGKNAKTAKIFMNNRSQAVRLPKEFQFKTREVFIRKEGDEVILSPRPKDWSASFASGHPVPRRSSWRRLRICRFKSATSDASLHVRHGYFFLRHESIQLWQCCRNLQSVAVSDVCISAITSSELEYGVAVSPRRDKDQRNLAIFLQHVQVLDYPSEASLDYAQIRALLKTRGALIGANDLLIAAHARCLGLTLVTNNTREFSRVPVSKSRTGPNRCSIACY